MNALRDTECHDHLECECGVVKGQGDFDFSKSVDISRLNKPASSILNDEIIDEVNSFILNNSAFDPYLIKDGNRLAFCKPVRLLIVPCFFEIQPFSINQPESSCYKMC